ncbi:unnamed protein product [Symbiodinium natans]|uniref:Uncharacterized protein n=1 Tax=Symbiodinium natans TaxID=878477 RepID=A0A812JR38_9DINO|nr:unnamed protein product [Symbiodinium natans]
MVHEEAEAASRAYEQQLASMLAVRDSLQAQLQAAVRVQTDLREHLDAERDGRAELEVAGERELVAWEKNKAMTHSPGTEVQSVRDAQRLQQHLNAEAVLCEREAAALRDRMEELEEEMQAAEESQQRCAVALGAAGCEWSLLHEEAEEAEQAASVKNAEIQRVTRQAREIQAQVHGVKEDILQCRQDHMALELKQERDFLHEEVQQEVNRQDDLYMELDEARRSRSLFQCLFPRKTSQPPLPPPSSAPPMRTRPQPLLRTAPTFQESNSGARLGYSESKSMTIGNLDWCARFAVMNEAWGHDAARSLFEIWQRGLERSLGLCMLRVHDAAATQAACHQHWAFRVRRKDRRKDKVQEILPVRH